MNLQASVGNRPAVRYGLAVGGVAAAAGLRMILTAWFGPGVQDYIISYPMVMAVALWAGFGPGMLATILAAALTAFWIIPPVGEWAISSPIDRVSLALFMACGTIMSGLGELFCGRRIKAVAYDREAAWLASAARLSGAQVAAHVGAWDWNLVTGAFNWSDEAWAAFGHQRGDFTLSYDSWLECVHPDDRASAAAAILAARATGQYRDEFRVLDRDGGVRWADSRGEYFFDHDGEPSRMVGTVRDITPRKQAEEALNRSHSLLRATLESTADGLLVIDLAGKITDYNQRFVELWRLPASVMTSGIDEMALQFVMDQVQEPARFLDKVRELYARPEESSSDLVVFKDGRTFERYSQPQWLDERPVGRVWSFRDATARLRAEEVQRASEGLFAALVEQAPGGVFVVDAQFRLQQVNARAQPVFESVRPLIGRDFGEAMDIIWGPEVGGVCSAIFRHTLASGERYVSPPFSEQRHDIGVEEAYEWETQRVTMPDGQYGVVCYFAEVTALARKERALRESEARERAQREELEALMDTIPVAIFITRDATAQQMTANRAARELLRLPPGRQASLSAPEAERPDFQAWAHGHQLAAEELPMQRATLTGQPVLDEEFEVVFPDGDKRYLLGSALPLFDETGAVRGCVGAFVDITARKRRELNLVFLAEIHKGFVPLSTVAVIMRQTSERIAEHLHLDHCMIVEVNETGDEATVLHDHHGVDVTNLEGVYSLKDYHSEEELRAMAAGKTLAIDDVRQNPRLAAFAELGIGSLVVANHVVDGRWKFILSALRREPGEWPSEDIELLAELAERIYLRIERARAEERLRENEARFRSVFHEAAVPMEVATPDGRFAQVNRAFCELLGYSEEQLLAMTFVEITHPEDRVGLALDPLRDLMAGTISSFRAEKRYLHRSGEVVWADVSISVVRGADGAPAYFIGQIQDITGRQRAEESLRKSDNMLALAIEAGHLGIWNWDQATRTLVWTERCAEMTGLPRDSEISRDAAIGTIHPEERARILAEATLAMEKKQDMELEYRTLWPDGTVRWLQTRGRAIYNDVGGLVRITGIIQDITERREAEDSLRRFNTELESLVDARTEVIKMTMKELQREFIERRRLEEEILDIGERAHARIGQDLHDDLGQQLVGMTILMGLLSSQLAEESHPRAAEAARLQTFLTGIIDTTRNLAKSLYPVELERGGLLLSLQDLAYRTELLAGVTCKVSADDDFQFEKATEIHLYRIVQESISNALKHGKARNIVIDCTRRDGASTLTVTDDGRGFEPPEEGKPLGIGLHLFQYRARLIGAQLTVARGEHGGCQVRCSIREPETPQP